MGCAGRLAAPRRRRERAAVAPVRQPQRVGETDRRGALAQRDPTAARVSPDRSARLDAAWWSRRLRHHPLSSKKPHTMQYLITGGAGFIGSHLAEALLA